MVKLRLRDILNERHITIVQLSEMSGISQSNLSNYMNGKISPTLATLDRIADALHIDISELFRGKDRIVLTARIGDEEVEINDAELLDFIRRRNRETEGNGV